VSFLRLTVVKSGPKEVAFVFLGPDMARVGKVGGVTTIGVSRRSDGAFRAQIRLKGKILHLGNFPTEQLAARTYDSAARAAFGGTARLNNI
jgi:hypothetical protein